MRRGFILGDPDEFPAVELTPAAALWRDEMVAAGGRVKELKIQLGNVHRREALHFEERAQLGAALREVEDFDEMHTVLHRLLVNMRLEWGRYDTRTLCVEAHLLWCEVMVLASDWEENLAGMEALLSDYAQVVPADHPAALMLRFWKAGYSVDWAEQAGGGSREIYLRTNLAAARDLHEVIVWGERTLPAQALFYARKQLAETVLHVADLNHPGPQWTYGYALEQFRQAVELGEKVLSEHDFDLESARNNYEALANLLDVD